MKMNFREMTCVLCEEEIRPIEAWVPLNQADYAHHCCALRETMGGIGHQLAHDWWCVVKHDPDAGLTRKQSAELVKAMVDLLGVEEVVRRAVV